MAWERYGDSFRLKISDECTLYITAEQEFWGQTGTATLSLADETDAREHLEEPLQLLEGCGYSYELESKLDDYFIENSEIFKQRPRKKHEGRITPGIYVGRLAFEVLGPNGFSHTAAVEVRSVKAEYRSEYRTMLEDITSRCTELLMIHSSPMTQRFSVDHETDAKTLYQRFAFVKSIVDSEEFRNAVHRVISMPVTAWKHTEEERDIRRAGRISSAQVRQIASRSDRIPLPAGHPLAGTMSSVPARLSGSSKIDSVDTPENRFIKHALQEFQSFCGMVCTHIESAGESRPAIYTEASALQEQFAGYLNHSLFREVSPPKTVPLNSPVLQRKEGYREILRVWLMFDLAAKLCWNVLEDDQYHAGKRDAAALYEYWVFFKLLDVVSEVFDIPSKETEKLIQPTKDGMGLQLRQGRHVALSGKTVLNNRSCEVRFHYNRTFGKTEYPSGGSWTQQMRPDYTLSIWPSAFSETEAEQQELIVHIHFDAKYKVEGLKYLIDGGEQELPENFDDLPEEVQQKFLNSEKNEQKEGTYKRADLLKMHAYKDAIRRTAGAYVLYPGSDPFNAKGFHEIIPGLGAFPLSPSKDSESGTEALKSFIKEVVDNFTNRTSQRESHSYHTYEIHQEKPDDFAVREAVPEKYGSKRAVPLRESSVLVGYYNRDQYNWIVEKGMYNIRVDKINGLAKYGKAEMEAKYLLLHGPDELTTGNIWEIIGTNPVLMSKDDLIAENYPRVPTKEHYLVYRIRKVEDALFSGIQWNIREMKTTYGRGYSLPFAVSIQEFMKAKASK